MAQTASDLLVERLIDWGVDAVFGLPGDGINGFAVVDANEPPMPPKIKPSQVQHLAEALIRGEPNRRRIALTLSRDVLDETAFAASPSGSAVRRATEAVQAVGGGDGREHSRGDHS